MSKTSQSRSAGLRNFAAACLGILCAGFLHTSFDLVPAGEDISKSSGPPRAVPVPTDTDAKPEPVENADATPLTPSEKALRLCTDMLRDGASYIQGLDSYTVTFHKHERIGGDMQPQQSINMKVMHRPGFAVYMKWQNFERGRQILYPANETSDRMLVKFGGLRRLLPAIKLDPNCSAAMAETRYPISEAGILGMSKQILSYRENDLKNTDGVTCTQFDDVEFDGRRCRVFQVEYDNEKRCKTYRKTLMTLDIEHGIPVHVVNYTWAGAQANFDSQQLDQMTMIEDYSFTDLNTSSSLVAGDFDRGTYRM